MALEGQDLFYKGEVAQAIAKQCQSGGHLRREDLQRYELVRRYPQRLNFLGYDIVTNPVPSAAGLLLAFALKHFLAGLKKGAFASEAHIKAVIAAIVQSDKTRIDSEISKQPLPVFFSDLDPNLLHSYQHQILSRPFVSSATTHISIADNKGNLAALTLSNGEGCGSVLPECGFMLNNMLSGLGVNWPRNTRLSSSMTPTLLSHRGNKKHYAIGSGGSSRLGSAILQVLLNVMQFNMPLEQAVSSARLHGQGSVLDLEPGFEHSIIKMLETDYSQVTRWNEKDEYFEGVHVVSEQKGAFQASADMRVGGQCQIA
jgi:gamma-glutamyltranspeptidase/glutathione hydrolase